MTWIAFVPIGKKGEVRSIQFDLSMSLVKFLRCHDRLLDSLFLYVICNSIYMYMFTVVPARCVLDYVWILSLDLANVYSCKCIAILLLLCVPLPLLSVC